MPLNSAIVEPAAEWIGSLPDPLLLFFSPLPPLPSLLLPPLSQSLAFPLLFLTPPFLFVFVCLSLSIFSSPPRFFPQLEVFIIIPSSFFRIECSGNIRDRSKTRIGARHGQRAAPQLQA